MCSSQAQVHVPLATRTLDLKNKHPHTRSIEMNTNNLPPQVLQTPPFIVSCWINGDPVHLVTVNLITITHLSLAVDVIAITLVPGACCVCWMSDIWYSFLLLWEVKYYTLSGLIFA